MIVRMESVGVGALKNLEDAFAKLREISRLDEDVVLAAEDTLYRRLLFVTVGIKHLEEELHALILENGRQLLATPNPDGKALLKQFQDHQGDHR